MSPLFAFMLVDPEGRETLCGLFDQTTRDWMLAITNDERRLPVMREPLLKEARRVKKRLRLVKFTGRKVVEDY